jgi:hypothetical protein
MYATPNHLSVMKNPRMHISLCVRLQDFEETQSADVKLPPKKSGAIPLIATRGDEVLHFESLAQAGVHFYCDGKMIRHAMDQRRKLHGFSFKLAPAVSA